MFSVIIPLYNKEQSVSNTIQSVLDQTFQDFEIVIVNDGSTDNSVEIVEKFDDNRIRLIHQENQGVSAARNKGIKEARYEWIAFLDADDLWKSKNLFEYKKAIDENNCLNWLISGYMIRSEKNDIVRIFPKNGVLDNIFKDLINGLRFTTNSVCVRKKLFYKHPDLFFRIGMNNSEDREVWYKLCCIDKQPYYINKALSIYDVDVPDSLTKLRSMTDKEHFLSMMDRLNDFECFNSIGIEDRENLELYIYNFNRIQLGYRYVMGLFKKEHRQHLPSVQYSLYKSTSFFPYILRRAINKAYKIISK